MSLRRGYQVVCTGRRGLESEWIKDMTLGNGFIVLMPSRQLYATAKVPRLDLCVEQ